MVILVKGLFLWCVWGWWCWWCVWCEWWWWCESGGLEFRLLRLFVGLLVGCRLWYWWYWEVDVGCCVYCCWSVLVWLDGVSLFILSWLFWCDE